jgi:DNA-binding transcriptional regulator/RsmH inhibitor MraZ
MSLKGCVLMSLARAHGYVGCAQTTLNKVGRSPVPATWLGRIQAQSPGEDRTLVIGLSPDPHRPVHLLLMAPEDVAEALALLERGPFDPVRATLWRRFNRRAVQITRDGSDRIVVPKPLRQAAGLESGELYWLGERNKLRIFSPESWALFSEIEDAESALPDGGALVAFRGRAGGLL